MKAKDIMSKKVLSVNEEMTVKEFTRLMHDHNITGAPVVDANHKIIGVMSVTDVIKRSNYVNKEISHCEDCYEIDTTTGLVEVHKYYTDELFEKEIKCLMTPKIISVSPEADLNEVIQIFLDTPIHRLLVMEGPKAVGIISTKDALKGMQKMLKKGE